MLIITNDRARVTSLILLEYSKVSATVDFNLKFSFCKMMNYYELDDVLQSFYKENAGTCCSNSYVKLKNIIILIKHQ